MNYVKSNTTSPIHSIDWTHRQYRGSYSLKTPTRIGKAIKTVFWRKTLSLLQRIELSLKSY